MGHRNPVSLEAKGKGGRRTFGAARRRTASLKPFPGVPFTHMPAHDVLGSILTSACELIAAEQGFMLVARGDTVLEIACTRRMRPGDVMRTVLGRAGPAVQQTLHERRTACADAHGHLIPMCDGFFEANAPALLCLPLDLGARDAGVLCLIRRGKRRVNDLDWEILQALSDQAALAIGAASHQTALSALEASLAAIAPLVPA
jgi:GAF domain-containing protein